MDQLTFLLGEPPAKISVSPDSEKDWLALVATSRSNLLRLLQEKGPSGWSGRTCPASCQSTAEGHLVPSLGSWGNAGMGSHTEFLTLNISEFPNGAAASPLAFGPCPPPTQADSESPRGEVNGGWLPHPPDYKPLVWLGLIEERERAGGGIELRLTEFGWSMLADGVENVDA